MVKKNISSMNRLWVILSVILIIVLGFFREFVFYNVNAQINYILHWQEGMPFYTDSRFEFLYRWRYESLIQFKWLMTVTFALLFLGNSLLIIYLLFKENKYLRWTIYFFFIILIVSALLSVFWYFFKSDNFYRLSRLMMDFVESPKPLMIIIPAIYLSKSTK